VSEGELHALIGARVRRIDAPRPDLFAFTLHRPTIHTCLVVRLAPALGWGLLDERPRGEPATAFVQQLRKHLENAVLQGIELDGRGASLELRRGDHGCTLRLDADPPNLVLIAGDVVVGAWRPSDLPTRGAGLGKPWPPETEPGQRLPDCGLAALGAELVAGETAANDRRNALIRAVERRCAKLRRRIDAITADVDRIAEVEPLRQRGSLLLSHLRAIPAGATEAELTDWHADPPTPLRIAIDPRRGPRGEAEALFRRARKLERGAAMALERHDQTIAELEALSAISRDARDAPEDRLNELEERAWKLGVRPQSAPREIASSPRLPYRTYRGANGRRILVGRSAEDNDALTLRVARPHDHWLHVRGAPGSHVVVPLERGETCPPDLLADAAHLAAAFSDARHEPVVEIQHTARRHVRKPRGSPPGAVRLGTEKTFVLRVDAARTARLVATEERG
jgi:predicted ribosome quality control (RQC) complex YloA/Tae2 family protein